MKEIYLLKSCNEWTEHSSSSVILATTDIHALQVAIAGEVLMGNMEYCGLSEDAGYWKFAKDVQDHVEVLNNLKYGYVEKVDCISIIDKEQLRRMYNIDGKDFLSEDMENDEDLEL